MVENTCALDLVRWVLVPGGLEQVTCWILHMSVVVSWRYVDCSPPHRRNASAMAVTSQRACLLELRVCTHFVHAGMTQKEQKKQEKELVLLARRLAGEPRLSENKETKTNKANLHV